MSLLAVIRAIFSILDKVRKIRDLLGGNAGSVITIADLERVVRGEHARFFNTIAFADIETIHNQFYNNWLPSITGHDDITAQEINSPTGSLFHIFQDLIRVRTELSVLMNRVREVFRTYQNELHVDELVGGILAFMHGFGLLLHIHGAYAELRRIQIGADTLEDRRLVTDTRAALQYVADGRMALELFIINSTAQNRRLDFIAPVRCSQGGFLLPPSCSFADGYTELPSTPAGSSLSVFERNRRWGRREDAEKARGEYVSTVTVKTETVFVNPAKDVLQQYTSLTVLLNRRAQAQGENWIITSEMQLKLDAGESDEDQGEYEDGGIVPFVGDEFITLSEKLRKAAAGGGK